jgi:hypothetical protein
LNFKLVVDKLVTAFKDAEIRYALIGGFALGLWGVPRATVDIDFLVNKDDLGKVNEIMTDLGYNLVYKSENVSQYVSPDNIFGEVDFLHAFREISIGMLKRTESKRLFDSTASIKVLKIEDLIGLKLQAMANDESRKSIDMPDIKSLIAIHKSTIDWSVLEEYCKLLGLADLFKELSASIRK